MNYCTYLNRVYVKLGLKIVIISHIKFHPDRSVWLSTQPLLSLRYPLFLIIWLHYIYINIWRIFQSNSFNSMLNWPFLPTYLQGHVRCTHSLFRNHSKPRELFIIVIIECFVHWTSFYGLPLLEISCWVSKNIFNNPASLNIVYKRNFMLVLHIENSCIQSNLYNINTLGTYIKCSSWKSGLLKGCFIAKFVDVEKQAGNF